MTENHHDLPPQQALFARDSRTRQLFIKMMQLDYQKLAGFQFISRNEPVYLPFSRPKYKISMGLVALQLKDWIEADEYFYDELKEKKQLLISN